MGPARYLLTASYGKKIKNSEVVSIKKSILGDWEKDCPGVGDRKAGRRTLRDCLGKRKQLQVVRSETLEEPLLGAKEKVLVGAFMDPGPSWHLSTQLLILSIFSSIPGGQRKECKTGLYLLHWNIFCCTLMAIQVEMKSVKSIREKRLET